MILYAREEVIILSTGSRIALMRTARRWSQTYLARQVGTNVSSVKDWESDVSLPAGNNLKKLAMLFSTTTDYLLEIESSSVIVLRGLSEHDIFRAQALIQTFIDTAVPSMTHDNDEA